MSIDPSGNWFGAWLDRAQMRSIQKAASTQRRLIARAKRRRRDRIRAMRALGHVPSISPHSPAGGGWSWSVELRCTRCEKTDHRLLRRGLAPDEPCEEPSAITILS